MSSRDVRTQEIMDRLKTVKDPATGRDLVSLGAVSAVTHCEGAVKANLRSSSPAEAVIDTIKNAADSALRAVDRAGMCLEDVTAVLAHQANQRILDTVADRLKVDRAKFVSVIDHTGNTSAGSVPLALDAAVGDGRVKPGDAILLLGFGGGLSWASTVAIWG